MAKIEYCPVCGLAVDSVDRVEGRDAVEIACRRCGTYQISGSLVAERFSSISAEQRGGLIAALRTSSERGSPVFLRSGDWERTAAEWMGFAIPQKFRTFLERVGDQSRGRAGARVKVDDELDWAVFGAQDKDEFYWLRSALAKQGLIDVGTDHLSLTPAGWETYRPGRDGARGTCFVAMAFDPSLDAAFDRGIRPAVELDCGFSIIRVDRVESEESRCLLFSIHLLRT